MTYISNDYIKSLMPQRSADANKYSVGSLLCICGSYSFAGAAALCAKAALRCGAGLVRCAVPVSIYPIVSTLVPEAVFLVLEETEEGAISSKEAGRIIKAANKSDAVVFGCGSKLCPDTESIAMSLLMECSKPLLVDADGINAVSKHINVLKDHKCPVVLTPHEGEMGRLMGIDSSIIRGAREASAGVVAKEHGCTVLLKGKNSVIVAEGGIEKGVLVNTTGNAGMAVAGSGDVLAGMTGAFMCQGVNPFDAAALGAYLHGLAGDLAKEKLTEFSLTPSDIIDFIPKAIKTVI